MDWIAPIPIIPSRILNKTARTTHYSLALSPLLANHGAALPMFQLQENLGEGTDKTQFRLWEVSPFDTAVFDGQ